MKKRGWSVTTQSWLIIITVFMLGFFAMTAVGVWLTFTTNFTGYLLR